ncbi:YdeI family protein [Candidatus Margulisiibacteriota bacterium]
MSFEDHKAIYCKDRNEWRLWLQSNCLLEKFVWLIYFKKHTKKPSIHYDDAVEEAICFGWIDGQMKRIDDERYMQRYTLRKTKSCWSEINIKRANRMIDQGLMTKDGLKIYNDGIKNNKIVPSSKTFSVPDDLMVALKKNPKALNNFQKYSPSAKLAFVYWVDTSKKDETRKNRIKNTVELLAQNKKFGDK